MSDPTLDAALARGALVVTPNKRLAREIVVDHDRRQAAAGRATWPAARVLPWTTFVRELVQAAQDAGLPLPPLQLDTVQAAHLWERVVRADVADKPLVDAEAAATLAGDAWELVHAYGAGMDGWRGFAGSDDVEAFVRWAGAYRREMERLGAVDAARAADVVAGVARELPGVATLDVALIGFTETSPQQQRLLHALEAAGARVACAPAVSRSVVASSARLVACETGADELACALDWARSHASRDPHARIGIVVLDLAERRAAVRAICEDVLCAPLQWPGRHDEDRPYDISLGPPLAEMPLVESALALIAVGQRPIERSRAAALVRSTYLPGAESDFVRRAALERAWLEQGRREIGWQALVDDIASVDKNLGARWRWATGELPRVSRLPPRAWVERWRSWLDDVGWCQDRTLSSAAFQAQGAWHELLASFARLAAVAPTLSANEALAILGRLAAEQVFQPATSGARIRVLGLLEATGLAFDALWVAGMASDAWPRSPEPNPLLPIAWQRERGVPRASAERELAFAREMTAQLAHAAPEVVFSYAAAADDHRRTVSPLLGGLSGAHALAAPTSTAARMFGRRPPLDSIADATAPPLPAGARLPGGTGVLEKQSDCPFRATASYRLFAQPWPAATLGLTRLERGTLLHATLDAFWRNTRTHVALAGLSDEALARSVEAAFEQAKGALTPARWESLPPAIAASEGQCICRIVREWLVGFDRERPPFTVIGTEQRTAVAVAGYTLDVRLDRIDALASGGLAVIDYKSGKANPPARWFEPRPQGMQVALYARASEQAAGPPVRALVYAQLRPGEVRPVGLAADPQAWPGVVAPAAVRGAALVDWADATSRLNRSIDELTRAFGAGEAAIAPRDPRKVCGLCGLHALCRIGSLADVAAPDAEGDDDD